MIDLQTLLKELKEQHTRLETESIILGHKITNLERYLIKAEINNIDSNFKITIDDDLYGCTLQVTSVKSGLVVYSEHLSTDSERRKLIEKLKESDDFKGRIK